MDQFIFRLFDTIWEAIRGVFRKKRVEHAKNNPKKKKKK